MSPVKRKIDRFFLISVIILTAFGFVIFLSASLGLLAQNGSNFSTVAGKQTLSLVLGIIAFYIFSRLDYKWLHKSALFILFGAIGVNLLLFIPSITVHFNGASRWIDMGIFTFQPSELLKIAFIIYIAAWVHFVKDRITSFKLGMLPYIVIAIILSVLLLAQKDTDTLIIILLTGLVMLFIGGLPLRYIIITICLLGTIISGVIVFQPYARQRFNTFLNRNSDTQGASYQINQSLIAIGSGQILGRGFGQSIQKFGYLPQPTDDSIFAVAAEEFGFVGSIALLIMYVLFGVSVFRIGTRSQDVFGGLLVMGIAILIIMESFMNMAAMLGIIPLSGLPILFVSHGGTALIITLITAGIVANVSKHARK